MSEVLLFTIVAVGLYFTTDWLIRLIESRRGEPLANRSLVFFGIIMVLAVISFDVIQRLLQGGEMF